MALRENERRILAQIERHLSEDDPELAGKLTSFGANDPAMVRQEQRGDWKPWVACAAIATMVVGILIVLFTVTAAEPRTAEPQPSGVPGVVAPESQTSAP